MSVAKQRLAEAAGYDVEPTMQDGELRWGFVSTRDGEESAMLYADAAEAWIAAGEWAVANALSDQGMSRREWGRLDLEAQVEVVQDTYGRANDAGPHLA